MIGYKENFPIYGVIVLDSRKSEEVISSLGSVEGFLKELGVKAELQEEEKHILESIPDKDSVSHFYPNRPYFLTGLIAVRFYLLIFS